MGASLQPWWQVLPAYRDVWLQRLLYVRAAESADEPRNPYTASLDKITIAPILFHSLTPASEN